MKKIAFAVTLLALAAPGLADEKETAPGGDPMAAWVPRKVAKEKADRGEIMALFKAMEEAQKKGDLGAATALVDFPVLMVTDDSKGEATAESWTREKWMQVMAPFYEKPMAMKVTHKPSIFLITDSLASVDDQCTMTMGKKQVSTRHTTLLVRREGKWLVKSMIEGGWGDMAKQHPPTTASEPAVPPSDTGSGGHEPTETQEMPQTVK